MIGFMHWNLQFSWRNMSRAPPVIPLAIALAAATTVLPSHAQDRWPTRPVTIVVPNAPGGFTDIMARLAAQRFSIKFGQPFIVENRAGGAAVIEATQVANAQPDGYNRIRTVLSSRPMLMQPWRCNGRHSRLVRSIESKSTRRAALETLMCACAALGRRNS